MIRLTTPEHSFVFPESPDVFKEILVTYAQGNVIILEKHKEDMQFDGNRGYYTLSQEETALFSTSGKIRMQLRALTYAGDALATDIYTLNVSDVLNGDVLQ